MSIELYNPITRVRDSPSFLLLRDHLRDCLRAEPEGNPKGDPEGEKYFPNFPSLKEGQENPSLSGRESEKPDRKEKLVLVFDFCTLHIRDF